MSFRFNWNLIDVDYLYEQCKLSLTESMAKSKRPAMVVTPIKVADISFGSIPPELAFDSIPLVEQTRVHLVFRLRYLGDASMTLSTLLEVNPLPEVVNSVQFPTFTQPSILAATSSLIIPFYFHLHSVELDSLVDMVYTKHGLVVSFRDNPVLSVEANSTLDSFPGVKEMITSSLHTQLSEAFSEDIPESIWSVTHPDKKRPDPAFGARRWTRQNEAFTLFNTLKPIISMPKLGVTELFRTLSVAPSIPNCILSRAHLAFRKIALKKRAPTESVDVGDVLQENISDNTLMNMPPSPHHLKPRRRVISLRNFNSPRSQSPSTDSRSHSQSHQSPELGPRTPLIMSVNVPEFAVENSPLEAIDDFDTLQVKEIRSASFNVPKRARKSEVRKAPRSLSKSSYFEREPV